MSAAVAAAAVAFTLILQMLTDILIFPAYFPASFAAICFAKTPANLQEGWQPSSFSSSRAAPGQRQQQTVQQFMDEDELEELQKKSLGLTVRDFFKVDLLILKKISEVPFPL
jgi:hypothetical protein